MIANIQEHRKTYYKPNKSIYLTHKNAVGKVE